MSEVGRFDVKPRICIVDTVDLHQPAGYYERVPFAISRSELDVTLDLTKQERICKMEMETSQPNSSQSTQGDVRLAFRSCPGIERLP
jgi:hypothetical protein